ncbi:MAG: molybdopterin biosynthesis protein [Syntrophomonadaceae bacterium]|jgi:molybdenum cofactor synthesis domain-containing protein
MPRKVFIENIPLEKAYALYWGSLDKIGFFSPQKESIDVADAKDRITAEPVFAQRSSPHYAASAMDGIAVKAQDTFAATEFNPIRLSTPNQYIEVDTGDYVPDPFDAVIMIEDVNFVDNEAVIIKPAVPWQHIRSVGEDLVAKDMIVPTFTRIGPSEQASFFTAAVHYINVVKRPVVAIIPTGTELVDRGGQEMEPGQIVESNSWMLSGLCSDWGAVPLRRPIVKDNFSLIRNAVKESLALADIIVICSGSSTGREDFTASLVKEMGELVVHGLAIRPGKPAILGIIEGKPVIGVPGYPVSAYLIAHLFLKPLIYRRQGISVPEPDRIECKVARKIASSMGVDEYVFVNLAKIENHFVGFPLSRGAGVSSSLVKADGVLCIPRGVEGLQAGEKSTAYLYRPSRVLENTLVTIGSHDLTLDFIADILNKKYNLRLVSANAGSMGGIMSLLRKETHFSGIHLLDPETGDYNLNYLLKYLPKQNWILINLVKRQQGLIVKKGNPLGIKSLHDLKDPKIRFINRQKGAGTRVLLDFLLAQQNIKAEKINGYNREEYTHLAVAAAVKNNTSDAGLGIFSSAKALDLDFIPVAEERYDICILPDLLTEDRISHLLDTIHSQEYKKSVQLAGGYNLDLSGSIIYEHIVK